MKNIFIEPITKDITCRMSKSFRLKVLLYHYSIKSKDAKKSNEKDISKNDF